MKILVVDEEGPARQPIRERLVREGYGVVDATDGHAATAVLEREAPDLVLLDVRIPGTDGIGILKGIQERVPDLLVIIITASTSLNKAVEAMRLGAFDHVAKPFDMDELTLTVKRARGRAAPPHREPARPRAQGALRHRQAHRPVERHAAGAEPRRAESLGASRRRCSCAARAAPART